MVIHRVEIIDRRRENEIFMEKLMFFFKALLLPLILGFLVFLIFFKISYGVISAVAVFFLVTYRKEIFGKVWGKRVWIGLWILALILLIWQFYPYFSEFSETQKDSEYTQSPQSIYEKLCKEQCDEMINANVPGMSDKATGYEGYKVQDNKLECNCGGGVIGTGELTDIPADL